MRETMDLPREARRVQGSGHAAVCLSTSRESHGLFSLPSRPSLGRHPTIGLQHRAPAPGTDSPLRPSPSPLWRAAALPPRGYPRRWHNPSVDAGSTLHTGAATRQQSEPGEPVVRDSRRTKHSAQDAAAVAFQEAFAEGCRLNRVDGCGSRRRAGRPGEAAPRVWRRRDPSDRPPGGGLVRRLHPSPAGQQGPAHLRSLPLLGLPLTGAALILRPPGPPHQRRRGQLGPPKAACAVQASAGQGRCPLSRLRHDAGPGQRLAQVHTRCGAVRGGAARGGYAPDAGVECQAVRTCVQVAGGGTGRRRR